MSAISSVGRRNPTIVPLYDLANALWVSLVDPVFPEDEALRESANPPKRKSGIM